MDKEKVTPTEEQTEVSAEKTELEKLSEELETLQKAKDELYDKYLRTLLNTTTSESAAKEKKMRSMATQR